MYVSTGAPSKTVKVMGSGMYDEYMPPAIPSTEAEKVTMTQAYTIPTRPGNTHMTHTLSILPNLYQVVRCISEHVLIPWKYNTSTEHILSTPCDTF